MSSSFTSSSYDENADFMATLEANRVRQELLKTDLSKPTPTTNINTNTNTNSNSLLPGWSQSHPFQRTFEAELRRVTKFVKDQQEGLERSAKKLLVRAEAVVEATATATPTPTHSSSRSVKENYATLHDLKRSARKTVDDCLALQEFFTSSRAILLESAAIADEQLPQVVAMDCSSLVHQVLPKAHLNSSLVCVVSDIYNALRLAEETILHQGGAGETTLWQAPSSFQRTTTKYWVKDENLTKLMMTCAMEAPLLVYGKKGPLTSIQNKRDIKTSDGDKLWDSLATRITSIYFDSDDMSLYKERLKRAQGAQLLRARWYGTTMPTQDKIIFLELKTHHEKWVANKSVKERASIQENDMVPFLSPVPWTKEDAQQIILRAKPNMKEGDLGKATGLLLRMHNLVVKHRLSACVRSVYDRAAFQSSKSNDLRLTLDRNVTLVNERVLRSSTSGSDDGQQWCLNDVEAQTARSSVVPFNVFEVKLAKDGPMPTGLAEAQNDSTIQLATKFSKFLTGAAAFNVVPTLPYWAAHPAFYTFFQLDKRGGGPSPSAEQSNDGDYNLMGSSANNNEMPIIPKGISIAPKNPPRIEPKTFFANERTFVQWISASLLLLSISGFMLNANGDFKTTAAVISFAAFGLVVYSTRLYFKRLVLLEVREPYGYFNKVNPIFLTSVVALAIFLIWVDSLKGNDFLDFFTFFGRGESERRLLRPRLSGRFLEKEYAKCPQEIVGTKLLINEHSSSLIVDFKRQSFLTASHESIYSQPMKNVTDDDDDDGSAPAKADFLIRINQSHLQGLAIVGNQLFAVSDGPVHTELIEMAWWGTRDGNERLRVVRRWTLEDSRSHVDGFSFVSSADSTSMGSFYINMNSSIRAYSVPARSENEVLGQPAHPMRLKSLNMKVIAQGAVEGSNDRLSTMITFEGITYFLRSKMNVLEAWNLTDGTRFSDIELPATEEMKWTGFALDRRTTTSTETPNVRGGDMLAMRSSGALFLHLMTDEVAFGGQIWSFPVVENTETPSGLFSVPLCQVATTSMA